MPDGFKEQLVLDSPNQEVYLPKYSWHIIQNSQNALQMCVASMVYWEKDYIRDYENSKK